MLVRFLGGWDFTAADAQNRLPADVGYAKGVSMGGTLPPRTGGTAPTFLVAALKDAYSGNLDRVVGSYVGCGNYSCGFARVRCPQCGSEYLRAFSCQTRAFCPSCAAKRAAIFGAYVVQEVVAEVGHAQWVFTVPEFLRPYLLHHREVLGRLSQAAWQTVAEMVDAAAAGDEQVRPGMVSVIQTARWDLGFSVHNSVTASAADPGGLERAARHLMRPPLSLARLHLEDNAQSAIYRVKRSARAQRAGAEVLETFDLRDLLARILMHVAEPGAHSVRHCGEYSVAARARRRRLEQPIECGLKLPSPDPVASDDDPSSAERRASRRGWAQLIRRIYESAPLLCDCGAEMKIIAVITEPAAVDLILLDIRSDTPENRCHELNDPVERHLAIAVGPIEHDAALRNQSQHLNELAN